MIILQEKLDIRKLEICLIQLVVVLIVANCVKFIPNTDFTKNSIVLLAVVHILTFYISNYYYDFKHRGKIGELVQTLKYTVFFATTETFMVFMLDSESVTISRRGLVTFLALNAVALYILNTFIRFYRNSIYVRRKSKKNILLLTTQNRLRSVLDKMSNNIDGQVTAVSLLDDNQFEDEYIKSVPANKLMEYATHAVVDEVFINLPSEHYKISDYVSQFELMGIPVSVNIEVLNFITDGEKRIQQLNGFSVVTFSNHFYNYGHIIAKRVLDVCGALVGLLLCGFASLFIVPQIKKDGGPAIFAQDRVGQNGRIFKFYKFRSMRVDAEEIKKELMDQNQMTGGMFKMDNDPRITKIGHFIRKTSLDELPQFWNVLKGDMSLVGTRPPTVDEYEAYTPEQKRRLSFKPGITGMWQVSGRSEITDFDEVVKLDVAYMDGWTIWRDIQILIKTVKVVVMRDGAK